ncbi:MAG: MBG domain-containing protein, partial [Acidobacteriota bacterium]
MNKLFAKLPALVLTLVVGAMASSTAYGTIIIVIENVDAAGVGFNDTTAVLPVGGNPGTTLGQQRLNAFQRAADIWGTTLPNGPTITVRASWDNTLSCSANSGTLGSAGSLSLFRNFPNAPHINTWFGSALANTLAGTDLDPANPEIRARFNPDLGTPGCLEGLFWYYGLDTNSGFNGINLVTVLLHEFSHGLGFQTFTSSSTGTRPQNFPSVYDRFLFDTTTNKNWTQMTDAERVSSAINTGNLVWTGPQVLSDATLLTAGKDAQGRPRLHAPNPVAAGSSVSHWSTGASPNQLMEPNISANLSHSVTPPQDLTSSLLIDIGWCGGSCPPPPPPPSPTPTPSPPANDNFASPQLISGCSGSVTGTNLGATKESGESSHSPDNDDGGGSVWYQWTAPASTSVTMTTAGSNYDTLLAVYTGNAVGSLTSIVKNDDVDLGVITTSTVTFTATAGTLYRIAVDGWGDDRGNITLNWTQTNCSSAKTDQSISFSPLPNKVFGDAPFIVSANASSGLPVSFSVIAGPATIAGSTVSLTGAGVVTVRASQAGDAAYNPAPSVDQSFTVAKASQTISFGALPNRTYGDPPFNLSATSSSGLSVIFQVLSGLASISGTNTVNINGVGTVTIRAMQLGNSNYDPAPPVDQSFTVGKANQTITFDVLANKTFGEPTFNVSATSSSGLPISFIIMSGPATISGNAISITGVGVVTVRASQAGDGNFNEATTVDRAFSVVKANQTITFNALAGMIFGDAPFNVNATSTSGLPVSLSIISGPATVSGNTLTISGAGTVIVRASQAGNENYNSALPVEQSFGVSKANQIITFDSIPSKTFGDAPFVLSAASSSGLPVSLQVISGPATLSGASLTLTGTGTVTVSASQPGDSNYHAATSVNRTFIVTSANGNISLSNLAHIYDGSAKFVTVTTNPAGLNVSVSYSQSGSAVASPVNAGEYSVAAMINDSNFQGSTTGTLVINKATPVITWNTPAPIVFGTPLSSTQLNASANVPGNFQYSIAAGTILSLGTYQVSTTFTPADVTNYNPATAIVQLIVAAAPAGLQLKTSSYTVDEHGGSAQIIIERTDSAAAASVDYATGDNAALSECNVVSGVASSRCDYATSIGALRFAAGETSKTIFIPIVDDSYGEGNEGFTITLSNASGATLGSIATATITIQDNETVTGSSPIDDIDFFIRQNYIDFLGREPDPAGLAGWRNVLNNCGTTVAPPCDRIEVSAGFFRSEEFQSRGYFIYRF